MTSGNRITLLMCILCAVLSTLLIFLIVCLIKSNELYDTQASRMDKLQQMLSDEHSEIDRLRDEIYVYKEQLDSYSQEVMSSDGYVALLEKEVEEARMLAGIVDLYGAGVTVTMSDSTAENTAGDSELNYIIHDSELLLVINELCDAGAEAVSLNGERIIATSEIRCTGATVSVNNKRYAPPFIIRAIGHPETMESALVMRGGIVETLEKWDINISIEKSDAVFIAAYSGKLEFHYAKPYGAFGVSPGRDKS